MPYLSIATLLSMTKDESAFERNFAILKIIITTVVLVIKK